MRKQVCMGDEEQNSFNFIYVNISPIKNFGQLRIVLIVIN